VIPKGVFSASIAQPDAADVNVRRRQQGRFAVIRFSGRLDAKLAKQSETRLREWIHRKGLSAADQTELAGDDPPWTPGPLQRNEVLIRLTN
jgi:DNA gyrase inhibitor GyrI